jgi:DNA-binding response OmpR family regulator
VQATRILFVDDEPSIRTTLAAILKQHGFDVEICSTVREAVAAITSRHFDVLIADLNIGEPGDGFTVISAMRRTQPKCANLILTGYPAFESALRAIRAQVDDYLIKPTDPQMLIQKIKSALESPKPAPHITQKNISDLLRENGDEIRQRTLDLMKSDPELRLVTLPDHERVDHLPAVLDELAELLESVDSARVAAPLTRSAVDHGKQRFRQGYHLPMLVEDARVLERAIFEVVQEHILELQLSRLVIDLKLVVDTLQWQLHESTRAFLESQQSAA